MKLIRKFKFYVLCPLCLLLSFGLITTLLIFISYTPTEYSKVELSFLNQRDSVKNHVKLQVTKEISDLMHILTQMKGFLEAKTTFKEDKLESSLFKQLSMSTFHLAHLEQKECINLFSDNSALSPYDYLLHGFQEQRNTAFYSKGAKDVSKRLITLIPYIQNYFKLTKKIRNPDIVQMFVVSDLHDVMIHYPVIRADDTLDTFRNMSNPPACKYNHNPNKVPEVYYFNCRDWYQQTKANQANGKDVTISNIYNFSTDLVSYTMCVSIDEPIQTEEQLSTGQNKMHLCIDKIPTGTKEYYEFLTTYTKGYFSVIKPIYPSTKSHPLRNNPMIPVFYPFIAKHNNILDLIRYEFYDVEQMNALDFGRFDLKLHEILTSGPVEMSGTYFKGGETMLFEKYPLNFNINGKEEYLAMIIFHSIESQGQEEQQSALSVVEAEYIGKLRTFVILSLIIVVFVFLRAFGQDFSASIVKPIIATQNLLSHKKFDEIEGNKAKIIKSKEIEHITSLLVDLHTINKKKLDQWGSKMDFDLFARKTYSQVGNTKLLKSAEEAIGTSLSAKNSFDLATMHFLASYTEDKQEEPTIEKCCFLSRSATQSSNRECDAALQENRGGRGS